MTIATFNVAAGHGHVDVELSGEIDLDNAPEIEAKIHKATSGDTTSVTLDLSGLNYVDSIGMRVLFVLASRLESRGVPLAIVAGPGSMARRVVELSGLTSIASLHP